MALRPGGGGGQHGAEGQSCSHVLHQTQLPAGALGPITDACALTIIISSGMLILCLEKTALSF